MFQMTKGENDVFYIYDETVDSHAAALVSLLILKVPNRKLIKDILRDVAANADDIRNHLSPEVNGPLVSLLIIFLANC